MEALKAEIIRKRKLLEEKQLVTDKKKYFKRKDLLAKEEESILQKLRKNGDETYSLKQTLTNDGDACSNEINVENNILPRNEVIRRLRERGEPILLFGESETEAFRRLRLCEISQPESNRGFRNDFQEAMDQVDQAYLNEILSSVASSSKLEKKMKNFN